MLQSHAENRPRRPLRCCVLSPVEHIARGTLASTVTLVCVLLSFLAALAASSAHAQSAGRVNFVKDGGAGLDRFTASPARDVKRTIRRSYARMVVHSPYFDKRLRWYPNAWAYKDLYGLFPDSPGARRSPEWILRGRDGQKLFLAFDCNGSGCPQYAGDITNPAFRRWWIRGAQRLTRRGYRGIYIDDVNMIRRVGDGTGRELTPISPRTGKPISKKAWRRAVASFTQQIRRALPRTVLVHNVIWFSPRARDRIARAQIRSADVIGLERGVNDTGLTGFGGPFGLTTFLRYVDFIHRRGKRVLFDEIAPSPEQREYGLAGYFLINNGRDLLASEGHSDPNNFWRGYRVRLGAARGRRFAWKGMLRRNFKKGFVLLNQPGRAPRSVVIPAGSRRLESPPSLRRFTLAAAQGAVVVKAR